MSSFTEESKKLWSRPTGATTDDLKIGCLQRIADSLEKMEKPYLELLRRVDWMQQDIDRLREQSRRLERSNTAMKGALTRAKRKAAGNG